MRALVICDSRGEMLPKIMDSTKYAGDIKIISFKGAGYSEATMRAKETISSFKPTIIIMCVGICDITNRDNRTKMTDLRTDKVEIAVEHVIDQINSSWQVLNNLGINHISFAMISVINLQRYNRIRNYGVNDQHRVLEIQRKQEVLNQSILSINRKIVEINKMNGTPTTWTAGHVHRYFRRHYHHYYDRLHDGCHLSTKAANYWVKQIVKTTILISN